MKKLFVLLPAGLVAACANAGSLPQTQHLTLPGISTAAASSDTATTPAADAPAPEHIGYAIELLSAGRASEAEVALQSVLNRSPADATAHRLLQQIEGDPIELLGKEYENYVVVAGDTMSDLAERYLGDVLLFYALSRYNGLSAPNALPVGRTLKIPKARSEAAVVPDAAPTIRPVDPAEAKAARLSALEAMNRGDVPQAIKLLEEAQALNPSDPAIQKDLERAVRIQEALTDG